MKLSTKFVAAATLAAVSLTGTSCSLVPITGEDGSAIVTQTGAPVLTEQAIMLAAYAALKRDVSCYDSFLDATEWIEQVAADAALSPEELREGITKSIVSSSSKNKELILIAFSSVLNYYECVYPQQALSTAEYKAMLTALVQGTRQALDMYDALKAE